MQTIVSSPFIYHTSIREMVEFIYRSGDIDTAYMSQNRALDGTRVHQRIGRQRKKEAKAQGLSYLTEVAFEIKSEHKGIVFVLKGRADGLGTTDNGGIIIEEFKSTMAPLEYLNVNDSHWHWAQAKCYGYMYLATQENVPESLTIALTYGQIETDHTRTFNCSCTGAELSAFFNGLLEKYWVYAHMDLNRLTERNETAQALTFPFGTYRPGQREMAVSVFAAVKQKRTLFAQAPTGIGKTISTLFPAVKSLVEGYGEKIFYLTAKVIARQIAEEAFRLMTEKGLRMRVITITARDKICFNEKRACNPEMCRYANGHFDRVNAAILDIISHTLIITREVVESCARKHRVCPGEFQLDAALFCDTIIGDYNHAYDPKAKLQRFFAFGGDYILLNDEAHNLVDRARDMFSAGLYKKDFTDLRKVLGRKHHLYKGLNEIAKEIKNCWNKDKREAFCREDHSTELQALLFVFTMACDEFLQKNNNDPQTELILPIYFNVLDYLRVSEMYDQRYAFFCDPRAGHVRLYCLDPSFLLAQARKRTRASVFFSATLTPLDYFRAVLGGEPDDYTLRLASPFPRENLCLLVDDRIATRYKHRAASYETIADRLAVMVQAHTGNYMVFFPSYAYLNEVYTAFSDKYSDVKTLVQSCEMDDESREDFLAAFVKNPTETTLAFVVLGGVFSEGIDLKGDRLSGTAIVGVGLPMVCAERDVLLEYFNKVGKNGFAFAYIYPGMSKVMQAAGRVIRTETDRGVVVLMDNRFLERDYRELFPPEWAGYGKVRDGKQLEELLELFWV